MPEEQEKVPALERIAIALERLVLLVATLLPEEQQPEDPNEVMTQDGPMRIG